MWKIQTETHSHFYHLIPVAKRPCKTTYTSPWKFVCLFYNNYLFLGCIATLLASSRHSKHSYYWIPLQHKNKASILAKLKGIKYFIAKKIKNEMGIPSFFLYTSTIIHQVSSNALIKFISIPQTTTSHYPIPLSSSHLSKIWGVEHTPIRPHTNITKWSFPTNPLILQNPKFRRLKNN